MPAEVDFLTPEGDVICTAALQTLSDGKLEATGQSATYAMWSGCLVRGLRDEPKRIAAHDIWPYHDIYVEFGDTLTLTLEGEPHAR